MGKSLDPEPQRPMRAAGCPAMRVLILNQPFHPDVVATAQIAKDLADELVARGHSVTAIASRSIYGQTGATLPKRETVDGIEIVRVGGARFGKRSTIGRLLDFAGYYFRAAAAGLTMKRFDVAICLTTPPYIVLVGLLMRMLRGTRTIYWLMDVYPDVMVAHGMIRERGLMHRLLRRVHRSTLKRVDRTIVLGRCMKERLTAQGAAAEGIEVIPVWSVAGEGESAGVDPREGNPFREEWGVGERLLVMYSGNFGLAHDVQTFLSAAERLREDDRIRFAFVGGGKRKEEVESFVKAHGLGGCIVAGYQPRERLADLLAAADVHLVTMAPEWWGLVVPSKFYGVAEAGRAVVFIGPEESEIARCVEEWGCGARIEPGDVEGLCALLRRFADTPGQASAMGSRGRAAALEQASRGVCTNRFIEIVERLGAERRGRTGVQTSLP